MSAAEQHLHRGNTDETSNRPQLSWTKGGHGANNIEDSVRVSAQPVSLMWLPSRQLLAGFGGDRHLLPTVR